MPHVAVELDVDVVVAGLGVVRPVVAVGVEAVHLNQTDLILNKEMWQVVRVEQLY